MTYYYKYFYYNFQPSRWLKTPYKFYFSAVFEPQPMFTKFDQAS